MTDERELLEQELERFMPDPDLLGRVIRRSERKLRRQRVAAGVLGIVVAVVVALAAVAVFNSPRVTGDDKTPTPTPVTELPEPMVELGPGYWFLDVGTGEAIRVPENITSFRGAKNFDVSPDGSMILFDNSAFTKQAKDVASRGCHQLYVANIDGSGLRRLTNDPVGASEGRWSPDGTKVVYVGGWGTGPVCYGRSADLVVMDLSTGATERLAHRPTNDLLDPSFAPDGESITFTSWPGAYGDPDREDLWTISVNGVSPSLLLVDRGYARFSPNGTSVAYEWIETLMNSTGAGRCGNDYSVAWVSDPDGSDPRPLAPEATADKRGSDAAVWSPDGATIAYSAMLLSPIPDSCHWLGDTRGVHVLDVGSGISTLVTYGSPIDWVDDHTLLVLAQRGVQPSS